MSFQKRQREIFRGFFFLCCNRQEENGIMRRHRSQWVISRGGGGARIEKKKKKIHPSEAGGSWASSFRSESRDEWKPSSHIISINSRSFSFKYFSSFSLTPHGPFVRVRISFYVYETAAAAARSIIATHMMGRVPSVARLFCLITYTTQHTHSPRDAAPRPISNRLKI